MKKTVAIVAIMGFTTTAWGTLPNPNSSTWEGGWELNGLTEAPPEWTAEAGTSPTFTETSIILDADADYTSGYDLGPSPTRTPDDATVWGMEYRVRTSTNDVDPTTGKNQLLQGNWYHPGAQFQPNSGNPGPGLVGLLWLGDIEPNLPVPDGHDFTQWHTYTLVGEVNGGVHAKFFIDGDLLLEGFGSGEVGGSTNFQIRSVGASGTLEIDYIRWTRLPEPATLGLVTVGSLLVLSRTRNRRRG